jgi:RNA polymerase sigma factor (sigma-70 family)
MLRMVPQAEGRSSAEHDVLAQDEADRLRQAIRALPQRQRQVLVLRYYLDQSEAEIADTLKVSRGSVKRHASRALATLARSMEVAR